MKVVYTKVVGDLFHAGHVNFLRSARALGDRLVVHVVHVVQDERVTEFKRQPVMTQNERLAVVAACRWVDEVLADGPRVITRRFMESAGYHVYAFACANEHEMRQKIDDCPDLPEEMIGRIAYTPGISTTALIERVLARTDRSDGRG